MTKNKMPRVVREMVKFGIVGAVCTAIDMCIYFVTFKVLHAVLWLAVAAGYGTGTVIGYFLNSRWTFRYDTKGRESVKLTQFASVATVGFLLTELIIHFLVDNRHINWLSAKAIAVVIVVVWNFTANKLWTFKAAPAPEA